MMKEGIVPPQVEGDESNNSHNVVCDNKADAIVLYYMARKRLLNVNSWQKLSKSPLSASFSLNDSKGNVVSRLADEGDFMRIDIPGPGPATGAGFDWVKIEKISIRQDEEKDEDSISMRVRPSSPPKKEDNPVAHFFSPEATSTFIIRRIGKVVTAEVHGRNEKPNLEVNKERDKVRNKIVSAVAINGIADFQWKELVVGLLS